VIRRREDVRLERITAEPVEVHAVLDLELQLALDPRLHRGSRFSATRLIDVRIPRGGTRKRIRSGPS
jgi:hypothetical protein